MLANDFVSVLEAHSIRDCALAVARDDVGMRLVENVGVRRLFADPHEQFEVGRKPASAGLNRPVILDLAGTRMCRRSSCRRSTDVAVAAVFAEAGSDDDLPQVSSALHDQP